MLFLALPSLRARWVSFIGVLITVAAAVTLMTATGALLEAGVRGAVPPERLSGAAIVVAGDQSIIEIRGSGEDRESVRSDATERVRLPSSMASRIASIEGVEAVVAERSFPAVLIVAEGTQLPGPAGGPSLGHSWTSATITPFALTSGRPPTQDQEIVVDAELARRAGLVVGDTATLVAGGIPMDAKVVGIATPQSGSSLKQQSAIFFSEQSAERLYVHAGEVDLFGVQLTEGADASDVSKAVRRTLGDDVSVFTGDKRGRAEFVDAAESNMRLIAISGSLGGIGLFVAVLVIAAMLSLFVQQRQREIALLRAMGATPRQVRRLIARETLIVTVVGAALGVWPGLWLASRLAEAMQGRGLLPGTFEIDPGGVPVIVAVGVTLLASQISAYLAGRRGGKVHPVEALTAAAAPSARLGLVRSIAAAVAVAGTGALFLTTKSVRGSLAPAVALGLFCTAVLAVGLLAPLLVRAGLRVLALPVGRLSGAGGFLAVVSTRSQARRLASVVTPLALTVGIAGMTVFQQATLDHEARAQSGQRLVADHVVDAGPVGLRPDAIDDLAERQFRNSDRSDADDRVRQLRARPVRGDGSDTGPTGRRARSRDRRGIGRTAERRRGDVVGGRRSEYGRRCRRQCRHPPRRRHTSYTHGRGRLRTFARIRRCRVAMATRRWPPHRRHDLARARRRRWRCTGGPNVAGTIRGRSPRHSGWWSRDRSGCRRCQRRIPRRGSATCCSVWSSSSARSPCSTR